MSSLTLVKQLTNYHLLKSYWEWFSDTNNNIVFVNRNMYFLVKTKNSGSLSSWQKAKHYLKFNSWYKCSTLFVNNDKGNITFKAIQKKERINIIMHIISFILLYIKKKTQSTVIPYNVIIQKITWTTKKIQLSSLFLFL